MDAKQKKRSGKSYGKVPCSLLPCPFCGGAATMGGGQEAQETYSIRCENGHHISGSFNELELQATWNNRHVNDTSDSHKETWIAAVHSTDRIFKETVRKGMDTLGPEMFYKWMTEFVA